MSTLLGDALGCSSCRFLMVLGCGKSFLDPFRIIDNCISFSKKKKIKKGGCSSVVVIWF